MAEHDFPWIIYLIFFIIPLARILPRLVRKWKKGDSISTENIPTESQFRPSNPEMQQTQESVKKPLTKEMQVLGELNKGAKDFNKIQKNLGINNQELESILNNLEDQGLMKVVKKQGLTGMKIELYPTDKGFKKYYS